MLTKCTMQSRLMRLMLRWNKRLGNRAPSAGTPSTQASAPLGGHFKPRFQRPTAWVAVAVEDLGPTPEGVEYCDEEGEDSSTKDSSNDSGGFVHPRLLGRSSRR